MDDRPKAKTERVVSERIDDELVVYDGARHTAHCLSSDVASVWELCDGRASQHELAQRLALDPATVERAVNALSESGLLDETPAAAKREYSRREAAARLAKAGGAAFAAPLIYSVAIPSMAAAISPTPACGSQAPGCTGLTTGTTAVGTEVACNNLGPGCINHARPAATSRTQRAVTGSAHGQGRAPAAGMAQPTCAPRSTGASGMARHARPAQRPHAGRAGTPCAARRTGERCPAPRRLEQTSAAAVASAPAASALSFGVPPRTERRTRYHASNPSGARRSSHSTRRTTRSGEADAATSRVRIPVAQELSRGYELAPHDLRAHPPVRRSRQLLEAERKRRRRPASQLRLDRADIWKAQPGGEAFTARRQAQARAESCGGVKLCRQSRSPEP